MDNYISKISKSDWKNFAKTNKLGQLVSVYDFQSEDSHSYDSTDRVAVEVLPLGAKESIYYVFNNYGLIYVANTPNELTAVVPHLLNEYTMISQEKNKRQVGWWTISDDSSR